MATRTARANSKLIFARAFEDGGVEFYGMPDIPVIEPADDDTIHEVVDGDRIDLLSDRYYGRQDRGWIIAQANGIEIYPNGINTGDQLRIPSDKRVTQVILPSAARGRQGRL